MKPVSLDVKDLRGQTLIIKVHARPLILRLAIAKRLFAAGAWVLGCKVEFA